MSDFDAEDRRFMLRGLPLALVLVIPFWLGFCWVITRFAS